MKYLWTIYLKLYKNCQDSTMDTIRLVWTDNDVSPRIHSPLTEMEVGSASLANREMSIKTLTRKA